MTLDELHENIRTLPNDLRKDLYNLTDALFSTTRKARMAHFRGEITREQFDTWKKCFAETLKIHSVE